ncbi:hypothetical protein TrVE_jg6496 [Triparma verrucosa]|uniref:non-specific serine/threonine protein kinase n=1 Tax=Triparma verrucosa TaxID=1606542 RepID=A0A9W7BAR5_9STRA|nr:hypothetical protein TrVE_jg6496 [Triparma verrucosa]
MKVPKSLLKFDDSNGGVFGGCSKLVPSDINVKDAKVVVAYLRSVQSVPQTSEASRVGADEELKHAQAAFEAAVDCLSKVKPRDLLEIKLMKRPPKRIHETINCCLILVNKNKKKWTWKEVDDDAFLTTLKNFDAGAIITDQEIGLLEKYIENPEFTYDNVQKASFAAANLCMWVTSFYKYNRILSQSASQTPDAAPTLDASEVARHQREALALGDLPFQRSRVMVVGQGRVGKTTLLRRLLGEPFDPNEKSTVGAVTQDIDTTMDARSVREQEGVDILQADTADGWNALLEGDADVDEEHVRAMRQEVARRAKETKEAKVKEEEEEEEKEEVANRQIEKDKLEAAPAPTPTLDPSTSTAPSSDPISIPSSVPIPSLPPKQQSSPRPSSKKEEEKMKDLGDVELGVDNKLRLNIWDYGGQRIFQSFQHLLVVRRAVYLVVFNMETFLESPAKAFSFLDFWLNTINIQANGAPVFLIGTRGDQVKDPKKYARISKLLHERYSSLLKDQLAVNETDGLCFFPVDNTSSSPQDLDRFKRLTALTEEKISNDKLPPLLTEGEPLPYIKDRVPIPWLNFIDELRKLSSERKDEEDNDDEEFESQPYLSTGLVSTPDTDTDADDSTETAMQIAQRCKVFEDLTTEEEKKTRLEVLLNNLHELGLVIFFSGSESLKSYVILQPQWLMDQICYVIRDYKRHRLRRDQRIQKKNLDEWLQLTQQGIASTNIIEKLWVGLDRDQIKFLRDLMIKIGLLVELNEDRKNWKGAAKGAVSGVRYFAPNIITTEDDDDEEDDDDDDNGAPPPELAGTETFTIASEMDGRPYLPNGFVERLIVWLMPYALDHTDDEPSVSLDFPHLSQVAEKGKVMVLIKIKDGEDRAVVALSSNGKEIVCSIQPLLEGGKVDWKRHAFHIVDLATDVNDEFFGGRLSLKSSRSVEIGGGGAVLTRSAKVADRKDTVADESDEAVNGDGKEDAPDSAILSFLTETCGIKAEKADTIAKNLKVEEIETTQDLVDYAEDDEDEFTELLTEAGCVPKKYVKKVKKGLKLLAEQEKSERDRKPYVLVVTGGDDLNTSEETALIHNAFSGDKKNRKALLLEENNIASMSESLSENRDLACVHFALHGAVGTDGKQTLAMRTSKGNSDMRRPDEVGDVIEGSQANVKSIVLNICQGAKSARDFIGGAGYVIGWKTDVVDSAAVQFSEQYYRSIKDGDSVEAAYFHAKTNMEKIYDWQFDLDPSSKADKKKLREKRDKMKRTTLKIAGVPAVFRKGAKGEEKIVEILEPTPEVAKAVERRQSLTYGERLIIAKMDEQGKKIDKIHSATDEIIGKFVKLEQIIKKGTSATMKAIFEATEVTTPTCFIILPYELEKEMKEEDQKTCLDKAGAWIEKVKVLLDDGAGAIKSPTSYLKRICSSAFNNKVEKLKNNLGEKELYLYLVDEFTGKPVVTAKDDAIYPIKIQTASDTMNKYLPMMRMGLQAVSVVNGATALANMFWPFVPSKLVPDSLTNKATKMVEELTKESNVEEFSSVQADLESVSVGGGGGKAKRGNDLRDFEKFLETFDEGRWFAGLRRVCKEEGGRGQAIWISKESEEKMRSIELQNEQEVARRFESKGKGGKKSSSSEEGIV